MKKIMKNDEIGRGKEIYYAKDEEIKRKLKDWFG